MDNILELILKHNSQQLYEILCTQVTKKDPSISDLMTKDFEELFVFACYSGSVSCLEVLAKFVIDVNFSVSLKSELHGLPVTPLRVAVEYDNAAVVKWLCCHRASVNNREAVWSTKSDDITSGTFITTSCRVPCMTPLHFAQSAACTEILLEHGADMCAQDCMGKTPVAMATLNGRLDVLATLCNHGAPLNLASSWGATPLMYAQYGRSKAERVSATEILCRSGADVDLQDRNGRTALHLAKDVECLCLNLAYHGDPSIETVFGKTALITAAENQRWDICRVLYDAQAVLSLGALGRGSSLFCSLSRDHHAWLVKCSRNVRDLTHLCRCVIRKQLKRRSKNLFEGTYQLPLPNPLKTYLSFLQTG
ncbi:ankyrin repeat domain-containing protein 61-like [Oculina patagonica]